jgi:hypothetical protein
MQLILVGEWHSVPVGSVADTAAAPSIDTPAERTRPRDPAIDRDAVDAASHTGHSMREQIDARAGHRTLEILAATLPIEWG